MSASSDLSLGASIRIPDDVLFRDLEGESVLLDLKSGTYFGLNELGTRIWQLAVADGQRLDAVHALLSQEYEVSREDLERDLLRLVGELRQRGLVEVDER